MTFKQFYLIAEGGATFAHVLGDKAARIPRAAVPRMMKDVTDRLIASKQFRAEELSGIGSVEPNTFRRSAGKKEDFGDLDIAVDVSRFPDQDKFAILSRLEDIAKKVFKPKSEHVHVNKGLNVVSFAYPIPGTDGLYGQVDLMPSSNHTFNTTFAYTVKGNDGEVYSRDKYAQSALSKICASFGSIYKSLNGDILDEETIKEHKQFIEVRVFYSIQSGINFGQRVRQWKRDMSGHSPKPYTGLAEPKSNPQMIAGIMFGPEHTDPAWTRSLEAIGQALREGSHPTLESLTSYWAKVGNDPRGLKYLDFVNYTEEQIEKILAPEV